MKRVASFIILIAGLHNLGTQYAMEPALPIGCNIPRGMYLLIMAARMEEETQPSSKKQKSEFFCMWRGCTKVFSSSEFLKLHFRVHTNERPYVCTAAGCEDRFKQLGHLKDHLRIHDNTKPYICRRADCGKPFRTSSARNSHEKLRHSANSPQTI